MWEWLSIAGDSDNFVDPDKDNSLQAYLITRTYFIQLMLTVRKEQPVNKDRRLEAGLCELKHMV